MSTNLIQIHAPRWKDRTVLVAKWRVETLNEIEILAARKDGTRYFPSKYEITGAELMKYPIHHMTTSNGQTAEMLVVPIDDLVKEVKKPKTLIWSFR